MEANLIRRISETHGVDGASYINIMPLSGSRWTQAVIVDNQPEGNANIA
jgi:hypothetical protein